MRIASVDVACWHLNDWYSQRTPAGEELPTVTPMQTMNGYGGWVLRADFDGHVALVRVGPRGGLTWLITLTDEQIHELR